MKDTLKIVIPMAGLGTRLRPLTWSKPKQLVSVAGKAVIDHVLDTLKTLPNPDNIELINIVGYLGEQIEAHIREKYPHLKAHYIVQDDPCGQSHAIHLARQHLKGPMLVVFADTLIRSDLSCLEMEDFEAIAWVKSIPDPRRFGVAVLSPEGWVTRLIEKPKDTENHLVVVGVYYFKDGEALMSAIEEQIRQGIHINGEYFLVDAINIQLERGLKMRTCEVDTWLDAGTPEALLETNRYLLENGQDNSVEAIRDDVVILPPVYIHPSAEVHFSVIGPHTSLGAGCRVHSSIIRNSILADDAQVSDVILEGSLIGQKAQITRRAGTINAGDHSTVIL